MAEYAVILYVALFINIIVTALSSKSCQKYISFLPCFASFRPEARSTSEKSGRVASEEEESTKLESGTTTTDEAAKEKSPLLRADSKTPEEKHKALLVRYLAVYLLATCSDWFQGPYVYALYDGYGFSQHDIAVLFVAGFGSSMIFGSFVGGMADSGGRKKYVLVYVVVYILSCLTKHSNQFWILMIGRLCGGVSTSLLFSVFDSWLIKAHAVEGLDQSFISRSFAAAQYGNSIVAITTGIVANKIASMNELSLFSDTFYPIYSGGFLNPFDAAIVALTICGTVASLTWDENYGDRSGSAVAAPGALTTFRNAINTTTNDPNILLCGLISSLFEGSMYVFVFMWTPELKQLSGGREDLPFGLIFSTFMVCCMIGSSLFSILMEKGTRLEQIGIYVFFVGAVSMAVINMSASDSLSFVFMNVFEMCVGMYFPIMGTLKSSIVPENQRSAIYNLYRIPLNFIVLTSLMTDLAPKTSFLINTFMLGTACVMMTHLSSNRRAEEKSNL